MGIRLVPLLVSAGHEVAAMTRSPDKAGALREMGGEPVVCDVYDADHLIAEVAGFGSEVVMHQLTDLPDDPSRIPEFAEAQSRIRREGRRSLIAAAQAAGATRFVAQSIAWDTDSPVVIDLESAVLDSNGVVIRYGQFYGPGTYFDGTEPPPLRIQIDEAAARTVTALLDAEPGVVTILE